MFTEGTIRDTREEEDFIELRVDGPVMTENTKGSWKLYYEINILIQSTMNDTDFHREQRNIGIVVDAFIDILVEKLGDSSVDDDSTLGCLKLLQDDRSKKHIVVSHFGQLAPDIRLTQATVEGHYEMTLKES
jgi:hypothetical protein